MGNNWLARIVNRLRGHRSPEEYHTWLLKHGRIVEGRILDTQQDDSGVTIFYCYNISNVQYESSQALTPQQLGRDVHYAPGATVVVRFDPRHPGTSIVQ
jgi:hypothetical protein